MDSLPRKMEPSRLAALDQRFKLTRSMNSEIAHVWYRLAIANRDIDTTLTPLAWRPEQCE